MPPDHIQPEVWFHNLGIYFENVPRVAFSVFGLEIFWYAILIVTGIITAYFMAVIYAGRSGQDKTLYTDLLILGIVTSFIGLRTYYMIFAWDNYRGQPLLRAFLNVREGGLAIYGGILGAILAGIIMSIVKKVPFSTLADTCIPSILVGQVIGRFGNFFNKEAFGSFTENIFAMRIRVDAARYITPELWAQTVMVNGAEYIQVHPTFLYEAMFNFLLMIALILYRPYRRFPGELLPLYMLGYGTARFFIEGLRTDQLPFFDTGFAASQIVSVVFGIIGLIWLVAGYSLGRRPVPAKPRAAKQSGAKKR